MTARFCFHIFFSHLFLACFYFILYISMATMRRYSPHYIGSKNRCLEIPFHMRKAIVYLPQNSIRFILVCVFKWSLYPIRLNIFFSLSSNDFFPFKFWYFSISTFLWKSTKFVERLLGCICSYKYCILFVIFFCMMCWQVYLFRVMIINVINASYVICMANHMHNMHDRGVT